jgi:hypothetical protein
MIICLVGEPVFCVTLQNFEILDSYHKLIYAKEMFEDGVNKAHNKETKEYYQNLLDDTILAIDAVWLDVTGQM